MKTLLLVLLALASCYSVFGQTENPSAKKMQEQALDSSQADGLPTSMEVKAGIEANLQKFQTVHLVCSLETKKTDAWYRFQKKLLEYDKNAVDMVAKTKISDPKARERAEKSVKQTVQQREYQLRQKPTTLMRYEYFTDGDGFQWRMPDKMGSDGFDVVNWKFASEPLNRDTLATVYRDYYITSFAPSVPSGARFWSGTTSHSSPQGMIGESLSDVKSADLVVPALVPAPSDWNRGGDYLSDFLTKPSTEYKVIGEELLADRKAYLVENIKVHPYIPNATGFLATCRVRETLHVWIDPARGFLPIKMEWYANIECDDPQYSQKSTEPNWVSTMDEIQELSNGGFYPLRITLKRYGPDPETFEPSTLTFEEQLKSNNTRKDKPNPMVVSEITTWITESIDISPINPVVFMLDFPENTHYYDKSNGIIAVQGKLNERLLAAAKLKKAFYDELKKNPAPELEGSVWLNSKPIRLDDVKGRPIILYFWSLGCGPCMAELPRLQEQWGKTAESNSGPLFISVHPFGDGNDLQQLKEMIEKKKITFPVMVDSDFHDKRQPGKTFAKYRIDFFPADVRIDEKGHFEKIVCDRIVSEGDPWMQEIEMKNIESAISNKLKNSKKPSEKSNPPSEKNN